MPFRLSLFNCVDSGAPPKKSNMLFRCSLLVSQSAHERLPLIVCPSLSFCFLCQLDFFKMFFLCDVVANVRGIRAFEREQQRGLPHSVPDHGKDAQESSQAAHGHGRNALGMPSVILRVRSKSKSLEVGCGVDTSCVAGRRLAKSGALISYLCWRLLKLLDE